MAESTQLRDHALPAAAPPAGGTALPSVWQRFKQGLVRSVFWSYERGTLPYDLIVLAILAFIFLAPRSWFQDRPTLQLTDLRHNQGLVEISRGKEGWTYLVDARLVDSLAPLESKEAIREILRRRLQRPVTIKALHEVRDKNNVILGYTVVVDQ